MARAHRVAVLEGGQKWVPNAHTIQSVGQLIPGVTLAFSGTLGSPNNAQDVGGLSVGLP